MKPLDSAREAAVDEYNKQVDRVGTTELAAGRAPGVKVSASEPAWLGSKWRVTLAIGSFLAAVSGMGSVYQLSDSKDASPTGIALSGVFALAGLVVAYLTIGGFGKAEFSIGTADSGGDDADKKPAAAVSSDGAGR